MKGFKRHRDFGFWDQDIRLSKLSRLGDPLERLSKTVDFSLFRTLLEAKVPVETQGKGGRPPYDYVLMFKILVLQRYYNLSDDQLEFQINDRMSFMRFLGLTIADDIPDSKTVWVLRERLVELGLVESLFNLFLGELEKNGLVVNEGKIVDASFVDVPRQRNSRDENQLIKDGETPATLSKNSNVLSQKDLDARWTKKNGQSYYGYKNHIKVDSKSKLITKYTVTDASVHDSQAIADLLEEEKDKGQPFFADSAYTGSKQQYVIEANGMENKACEKGAKNKPLTQEQIESNRLKSKTRSRVEHIFGFMEMSMNGMYINTIGIKRATATIGMMNLVYNMFRKASLV